MQRREEHKTLLRSLYGFNYIGSCDAYPVYGQRLCQQAELSVCNEASREYSPPREGPGRQAAEKVEVRANALLANGLCSSF
jgi:hypothetical protein